MSARRNARTRRRVDDAKHTKTARTFSLERRIRQSFCSNCGEPVTDDDWETLLADYYLCALCAGCRGNGVRRRRVTDAYCEHTLSEYPRHPEQNAVAAIIGNVR